VREKNDGYKIIRKSPKKVQTRANALWKWWYEGDIEKDLFAALDDGTGNLFAKEWAHAAEQWFKGFRERVKRGQVVGFRRTEVFSGFGDVIYSRLLEDRHGHVESNEDFAYFVLRLFVTQPMITSSVKNKLPVSMGSLATGICFYTLGRFSLEIATDFAIAIAFSLPLWRDILPNMVVIEDDGLIKLKSTRVDSLADAKKRETEILGQKSLAKSNNS